MGGRTGCKRGNPAGTIRCVVRGCALVWLLAASFAEGAYATSKEPGTAAPAGVSPETAPGPTLLETAGARPLTPAALAARPPRLALRAGERLEYAVSYLGVPVGRAFVEVAELLELESRRVAHLVAGAETNAFFSAFYPVRDRAEAWVDLDAAHTLESRWWMGHRRRRIYEALSYDWEVHSLRVLRHRYHSGRGREQQLDFGPFVYDALDLIFTLRGLDPRPGARIEVPVYASKKIYTLRVDVGEVRVFRSPSLGPTPAWRLRATTLLDGVPKAAEGKGVLWVSAAAPHIPLRLEGWFRGSETFRVTGLRIELVRHRPGSATGYEDPRAAVATTPPLRSPVPTEAGRPVWDVPISVRTERQRRGWFPFERRFRFTKAPAATWPPPPLGPITDVPPSVAARP